jgi:hypothetical protein
MEMRQWVSFALLSSYKAFHTAVNNIGLSVKFPIFCQILTKFIVFIDLRKSIKFHENHSIGSLAGIVDRQMEGRT